jgi:uncharacterized integral membrane protein
LISIIIFIWVTGNTREVSLEYLLTGADVCIYGSGC